MNVKALMFAMVGILIAIFLATAWVTNDMERIREREKASNNAQQTPPVTDDAANPGDLVANQAPSTDLPSANGSPQSGEQDGLSSSGGVLITPKPSEEDELIAAAKEQQAQLNNDSTNASTGNALQNVYRTKPDVAPAEPVAVQPGKRGPGDHEIPWPSMRPLDIPNVPVIIPPDVQTVNPRPTGGSPENPASGTVPTPRPINR